MLNSGEVVIGQSDFAGIMIAAAIRKLINKDYVIWEKENDRWWT